MEGTAFDAALVRSPAVQWGRARLEQALAEAGLPADAFRLSFRHGSPDLPDRWNEQGFHIRRHGPEVTVSAPGAAGALYALLELADRVDRGEPAVARDRTGPWEVADAPVMRYRGYALGLQRPVNHFPDHKSYDWPVTRGHFPWFYDRIHMTSLLDRLAKHRANALYLWSGHPFASLLSLPAYPEMPEVSEAQLRENQDQYHWLCREAEKRGIWVVQKFYNIHMSDPLAKARGWDILGGEAHPDIAAYTRACLAAFVRTYPSVGLMACLGEVLREEDKGAWLDVILDGILDGLGPEPATYPPVVIRAHSVNLPEVLPAAMRRYPNLVTMMKHNNESFIATRPDEGNTVLARLSGAHIVNVHLNANLEPFSWGSPRFIRRTVLNLLKAEACGIHIFPLRYWDWPESARTKPLGDQLHEHVVWWSAWSRYAWNPDREESAEDAYWGDELAAVYALTPEQGRALLDALQEAGPVLGQIAGQFIVTSGNGQSINLGQFLVPLAFSRQQYQVDPGYSMGQFCGFPLVGETMWSPSPASRMQRMEDKCTAALARLAQVEAAPVLDMFTTEVEIMRLVARFYRVKAEACAVYFRDFYGAPDADPADGLALLEESVGIYRELTAMTTPFFRDASSLHHYRRMPLPVADGYLHWADCLPAFERELELARAEGLPGLLRETARHATPMTEWNVGSVDMDEV